MSQSVGRGVRTLSFCSLTALVLPLLSVVLPSSAQAALPEGFEAAQTAVSVEFPTNVAFAPDGRVFVNQWAGVVNVFDSVQDATPTVLLDIRDEVFTKEDSGLNGLAVDPQFPTRPYLYISYQYDAPPGGTAPTYRDDCPVDGCPTVGRVERLTLSGDTVTARTTLLDDSCNSLGPHAIDDVAFGPGGVAGGLYVSVGDGSTSAFTDYGQRGNPCEDPPTGRRGDDLQPSTSEGGAFHSQDAETDGDPLGLSGSIARIHPDTGAGLAGNPFASSTDENKRKLLAYGLRNPFRFTFRPGTTELYVGDVGWNNWEELNVLDTASRTAPNFGWPCYEGGDRGGLRMSSYDNLDNVLCDGTATTPGLYDKGTAVSPYWAYRHSTAFLTGGRCPALDAGTIGGMRFYSGPDATLFPAEYRGAFFFSDFARGCLLVMQPGADGRPDPQTLEELAVVADTKAAEGVVDLEIGRDGALYSLNFYTGRLYRISHSGSGADQPPVADATATPSSGPLGTTVTFDASASRDPEGGALTYAWDLDGDGVFTDGTGVRVTRTYDAAGSFSAAVRVTDPSGLSAVGAVPVTIGGVPQPTITAAAGSETWATGESLAFTASGTDSGGAPLPASAFSWTATLEHCEFVAGQEVCHSHPDASATGSTLSLTAPDHSYPSHLLVALTATGSDGSQAERTLRVDPETTTITLASEPTGLQLGFDGESVTTPATQTVIVGSRHSVSAPDQSSDGTGYTFSRWSDGGAANHDVVAGTAPSTLTATFTAAPGPGPTPTARGLDLSCPTGRVPGMAFTDVPAGSTHARAIACLAWWDVTHGRTATSFAPGEPVSRAAMASFVARVIGAADPGLLQPDPPDAFTDDEGSVHELAVDQLAAAGIVSGTGGGRYDPSGTVTRGQMAGFLSGAAALVLGRELAAGEDVFADDDGNTFEADINRIARAGLTTGRAVGVYEPGAPVRRDQMGSFLARTLDLLVEDGAAGPPA